MFKGLAAWFQRKREERAACVNERHFRQAAIDRALEEFRRTREENPLGAHVLRVDGDEVFVRVMYMTNHIPPDRAWFAVSRNAAAVRELSFDDVSHLETPWR